MKTKDLYSQYKLLKHLDRLTMLKEKGFSCPIFVDFSITNVCSHNCPLCISFEDRKKGKDGTMVDYNEAKRVINQLKNGDVKAVYLTGGGDPSCHPDLEKIIRFIKEKDIEVSLTTNGDNLSKSAIETITECCSWMRVSLDADGPKIYKKTHGMNEASFNQVISNMSALVDTRKKQNSELVIGASYLLGPHTIPGIYNAAKLCKEVGINYIRFRPFFESMSDENKPSLDFVKNNALKKEDIDEMLNQFKKCKELNDDNFSASYPANRVDSIHGDVQLGYKKCYAAHVMAALDANLGLYPCCVLRYNSKYCLGNLKENSFEELWFSEKRKQIHDIIDLNDCPKPCQYDSHNKLLNAMIDDIPHHNFL
jgi:MoaA/NifB/PqqE/SkfB family radical SAM enzyme